MQQRSVEAAESRGLSPLLVGFDMNDVMREMIRSGRLHATVVQDPTFMGLVGLARMVDMVRGQQVPQFVEAPAILVSPDNLDDF